MLGQEGRILYFFNFTKMKTISLNPILQVVPPQTSRLGIYLTFDVTLYIV